MRVLVGETDERGGPNLNRLLVDLLLFEPKGKPLALPILDSLTQRMITALRVADIITRSYRVCSCGAVSVYDVKVNGKRTSYLAPHILAYHRSEVPAADLEVVRGLRLMKTQPSCILAHELWPSEEG